MSHANAALTPVQRLRVARLIVDDGWPVAQAAVYFHISWPTAKRWATGMRRWARRDAGSLIPSAPLAEQDLPQLVRKIVHLRWKKRLGPVGIGGRLGMPASTVHAVLVRCRLNRLRHVDVRTGEPVRRYEHEYPGSMIHVDVKKLGNIPDGGGWRRRPPARRTEPGSDPGQGRAADTGPLIGTRSCTPSSTTTPGSPTPRSTTTKPPTPQSAFSRRAVSWFADRGVTVERVLSDNGSAYRSHAWRDACAELAIKPKEDPPLPAADQREDRTLPPHHGRRLGLRPPLQHGISPTQRPPGLAARLQSPQAPHRHRQAPHPSAVNQPAWALHLAPPRAAPVPSVVSGRR